MAQWIKLDTKNHEKKLGLLHQMLIYSMKCKQTTDLANVTKLKDLVNNFEALYSVLGSNTPQLASIRLKITSIDTPRLAAGRFISKRNNAFYF